MLLLLDALAQLVALLVAGGGLPSPRSNLSSKRTTMQQKKKKTNTRIKTLSNVCRTESIFVSILRISICCHMYKPELKKVILA
jgi:hypothetical protein